MSDSKITPQARVEEYITELTLKNNNLYCPWCEVEISGTRKSTIDYHLESKAHIKNKSAKPQRSLAEYIPLKSDPLKDFVLTILCSGIPLYKTSSIQTFFLKRRFPSLALPSNSILIKDFIPSLYKEAKNFIKENYKNSQFILLVDESKDSKSRSILNTIAYFMKEKEFAIIYFENTHKNKIFSH